jgi:hypothetical protein
VSSKPILRRWNWVIALVALIVSAWLHIVGEAFKAQANGLSELTEENLSPAQRNKSAQSMRLATLEREGKALPNSPTTNEAMAELLRIAHAAQVAATNISVQQQTDNLSPRFRKVVLSARLAGKFADVKKVLSDLQGRFGFIALEQLSIERSPNTQTVDVSASWGVYFTSMGAR